jgi:hypothetical protein
VCVRYYYEGEFKSQDASRDYSALQQDGKEDKVQSKTDHDERRTSSAECKVTIQKLKPAMHEIHFQSYQAYIIFQ